MRRQAYGWGYCLPQIIGEGGGSPSVPVGALATYTAYSPSNFTLVTGDSINVWNDETTNGNDLTQSTSGNQPTLVEDNTLTQFTASNQPILAKDKQVTQDTLSNMPTYDATEGALAFDGSNDGLKGVVPRSGAITFELEVKQRSTGGVCRIIDNDTGNVSFIQSDNTLNTYTLFANAGGQSMTVTQANFDKLNKNKIKLVFTGSLYEFFVNDIKEGEVITTDDILINTIGFRGSTGFNSLDGFIYYFKQWNSADSSGTPDFYLDGSDPSTMLNGSYAQPVNGDEVRLWHDPSAVDVLEFDVNDNMEGLPPQTGDFTYVFKYNFLDNGVGVAIANLDPSSLLNIRHNSSNQLIVFSTTSTGFTFPEEVLGIKELEIKRSGNDLTLKIDGVLSVTTFDVTGYDFTYTTLGKSSQGMDSGLYYFKIWNSAISTGAPDFTLTADPTKMRTSANTNPVLGEGVAKWYADEFSAYRDSRVVFDGTDDFMEGLPPQAGDFTYVFDLDVSAISQTEYIFSGADSSALLLLSDNNFYLRQSTSASDQVLGTEDVQAGSNVYTLVKDGDDVRWYVNSILKATLDVTGRSFNFNTVGANADSMGSFNSLLNVFDRALTQTEIDYYSYLRSETGEILLPPLLPSVPMVVNSIDLNRTSQYLQLQGDTSRLNVGTSTLSFHGYFIKKDANARCFFSKYDSINQSQGWFIEASPTRIRLVIQIGAGVLVEYEAQSSISIGVHSVGIYWARSGRETLPIMYLDGVAQTVVRVRDDGDPTSINLNNPLNAQIGGNRGSGGQSYFDPLLFMGMAIGQELTQADFTYLHNGGIPPCWQDVATDNPTLYAKFDEVWDLGTYNGSTEATALTGKKNSWAFTNVNSAPFTDQGLTVECS